MSHHVIIDKEFNLWGFGENHFGQLGVGDKQDKHSPVKLPAFDDSISSIIQVSGILHTLFLDDQDDVWVSGMSGLDGILMTDVPVRVNGAKNIVKIAAGSYHDLLLDKNGNVFSFGNNNLFQLGTGDREYRNAPTRIENIPKISDISCGPHHSILIDCDGNCWSFGSNSFGQLGLGDTQIRSKPTKIENIPPIRSACCAIYHTILISMDDIAYSFGHNDNGQLGLDDQGPIDRLVPTEIQNLPPIKLAYSIYNHTIFLDINNIAWGCGANGNHQLGLDHRDIVTVPEKLNFPCEICSIICGVNSTIIINSDGELLSFGLNDKGQLGLGHTNNVSEPTKISVKDESGQVRNLETFVLQSGRGYKTKSARYQS